MRKSDSDTLEGRYPFIQGRAAEESVGRCCMMQVTPPPVPWLYDLFICQSMYILANASGSNEWCHLCCYSPMCMHGQVDWFN